MGISVAWEKKEITSEDSHMSYSTCARLLDAVGLSSADLQADYFIQFRAKKVIYALENYLADGLDYDDKLSRFTKQILNQYREFIFQNGFKPTHFGGA